MKLPIKNTTNNVNDLLGRRSNQVQGLYVHVPFCAHKCGYCDFYSIVDLQDRQGAYIERIKSEISYAFEGLPNDLKTIYVGGGTPTLLRPDFLQELITNLNKFRNTKDFEFTIEANPETITSEIVDILVKGGVTRVSMGVQTFSLKYLKTLERSHDPNSVFRAMEILRKAGLHSVSMDLIFGIPEQSLSDLKFDLEQMLRLSPNHTSVYGLIYEPSTAMTERLKRGEFKSCNEELEASMYELVENTLVSAGMYPYELSSWSMPGHECQHNINYWMNLDWWGIGPSASGHVDGVRWKNIPHLNRWLNSSGLSLVIDREEVEEDVRAGEMLMSGLRLTKGINGDKLERILSMDGGKRRRIVIDNYVSTNLLKMTKSGGISFTFEGRLLADLVIQDLIV